MSNKTTLDITEFTRVKAHLLETLTIMNYYKTYGNSCINVFFLNCIKIIKIVAINKLELNLGTL